jgi:hypothetical protein
MTWLLIITHNPNECATFLKVFSQSSLCNALEPMFRTANSQFAFEEETPVKKTLNVKENMSDLTSHPHFAQGDGWLLHLDGCCYTDESEQ